MNTNQIGHIHNLYGVVSQHILKVHAAVIEYDI